MKKLFHILFILPVLSFSQKNEIPEINWQDMDVDMLSEQRKPILDNINVLQRKLKDKNALIIGVYVHSPCHACIPKYSGKTEYFIYQNEGEVKRYTLFRRYENHKIIVKRKKIKKKHYQYYWNVLYKTLNEKKLEINSSKLNITKKPIDDEGGYRFMLMLRSEYYAFEFIRWNNSLMYTTTTPHAYIDAKFPGWRERKKLVDLISEFEELIEKYE